MKQESIATEETNLKNKKDFSVSPRKVYSQNFTIEKDVENKAEKKKINTSFLSFSICVFLLSLSAVIAIGGYYYFSQSNKTSFSKQIYFTVNSLNSLYEKKSPSLNIPQKKFDGILTAKAYGIYELSSGKTITEQNANTKLPFASITKLLTVNTMESLFDKNTVFDINPLGVNILGSRADIKAGDKFNFTDAIYGMMLPSGNDIAISVAMKYGYEDFIKELNNEATALNLKNTKLSNPIGFDDVDKHYSSVQDIFTMSRLYLNKEINRKVAMTKEYEIKSSDPNTLPYKIKNTNDLLLQNEVFGLKTGTEDLAGQCLVLDVRVHDKDYIVILLGSSDRFKEGQKILDWLKGNG